ncbi:glucosyltransferase domain-containing protein [Kosakonia sp. MUSA4]|uniref:glucosyltransferase domain-containing protein n=1 Tax=Kosakonia sp. MUSA4 TaxID=2067958 RepID=UPI001598828F|nr:glucosyltransferase domain-containing protein [Kosakonia sp. MUSA4]QJT81350.1 hypothetical protein C0557_15335 [Kosakonia sp. MUSA4]
MISFYNKELSSFNAFLLSLVVITLGYYPLINDRIYFVDDITRSIKGYFGWIGLGRPLTEWLAMVLSTSSVRLADITPLPQLLSMLALSSLVMILLKNTFKDVTVGNVLICSTIAVNPLIFGNMLFRFDSLSMVLSVLLPVMAWDLLNKNKMVFPCLLLIACLSFYQPAIAIFPLLIMTTFLQSDKYSDKTINYIFKATSLTFIGCIIYYLAVVKLTIKESEHRADLTSDFGHAILSGLKNSLVTASQSYGHIACVIISIATIIFAVIYAKTFFKMLNDEFNRKKYISILLMIAVPFVIILCTVGVNLILSNGYYPVRVLFPVSFIIFMMLAVPANSTNKINIIASILSTGLIFASLSVIYATTSALYNQQRYDSYVLFSLIDKLSTMNKGKETYIFGTTEDAEASKTSARVFPILKHIKNNYYDMTLSQSLINNGVRDIVFSGETRKVSYTLQKKACNRHMDKIFSTPQYSIFEDENHLLISLGKNNCSK